MNLRPQNRPNSRLLRSGFTLIELLVVIAVLGILASIILSTIGKVRDTATRSKTVSNLRQLSTALSLYEQDNRQIPVGDLSKGGLSGSGRDGRGLIWVNALAPYISRPDIESTPLDEPKPGLDGWEAMLTEFRNEVFVCAGLTEDELAKVQDTTRDPIGGIGYNIFPLRTSTDNGPTNAKWGRDVPEPIRLQQVTFPAKRVMFATGYDWWLSSGNVSSTRFGDQGAAVFYDGHAAIAERQTLVDGIMRPDKL